MGLNRTTKPQRVIVVGAGLAGLVTAKMLGDAGHKVRGPAVPWCRGGRWAGAGGVYLFPLVRDTPTKLLEGLPGLEEVGSTGDGVRIPPRGSAPFARNLPRY